MKKSQKTKLRKSLEKKNKNDKTRGNLAEEFKSNIQLFGSSYKNRK